MLQGKTALITGISSGIGLATAARFLKEGAQVIGVGEDSPALKELGGEFRFLPCDVTRAEDILAVCAAAEKEYEKLDILLTVCDRLYGGKIGEIDAGTMEQAGRHIVYAPMLFTSHLLGMLRRSELPSIIHDISVSALLIDDDFLVSALNVSLINFVRNAAPQLRPTRINGVLYGLIKGHLLSPEKEAKYTAPEAVHLLPAKRLGTPEDVANVNTFLASDKSKYFNSSIMQVDGGLYMMAKNPAGNAMVPKAEYAKRDIWTADTLFQALHLCDDPRLALALNVSFCCSLRMGEMLGLTWDCIDISEESIAGGTASVYVNKELQRVNRKTLDTLEGKDVMLQFPSTSSHTATVLVLKSPKTESSVRKVFLPKAVANMLVKWKNAQDEIIEMLGSEYHNFNLVFAGSLGLPTEGSTINGALRRLIKENDLPPVVFHSFRHPYVKPTTKKYDVGKGAKRLILQAFPLLLCLVEKKSMEKLLLEKQ